MSSDLSSATPGQRSLDLFCKVVDNYGDIGICWRISRQFAHEHGIAVRLWVDDLASFKRICPEVDTGAETQQVQGITILRWHGLDGDYTAEDIPDIVIEFFGCDIPPKYIAAMAQRPVKPVWFNLEGLTAEDWVEGCHTLPSPHRSLPLTKYFFFPGFNERTGGLSAEAGLNAQRKAFQQSGDAATFLARFGVTAQEMASIKTTLFCYEFAPVEELLAAWQASPQPVTCLIPEGVARAAAENFLGCPMQAGTSATHGALTLRVLPFAPQTDYDKLLWSCDLNFVRGEDSFVRAQWTGKPFVWNIYKQDENLHHKKLNAFLGIYTPATAGLSATMRAWNSANTEPFDWTANWPALLAELPAISLEAEAWIDKMLANGDFVTNLLSFAARMGVEAAAK